MSARKNSFAVIPSIEHLLRRDDMQVLAIQHGHNTVRDCLRDATKRLRFEIGNNANHHDKHSKSSNDRDETWATKWLVNTVTALVNQQTKSTLASVFNLTGTVLHTNLGRAVLPEAAINAMIDAARHPTTVEYDLATGQRGDRDDHVADLLCRLTGAEAATVVNNNAAAVMLCLNSLALNREIPVSRGELIEIGGAFRMPDIMERSGCRLVEVGTTNRTHLSDYAEAITEATAALMIVHPSNYDIRGFTSKPDRRDIASLAHEHQLPLIDDLGSGTLIDLEPLGLPHEVTVREAIAAGADIVSFSGDKLLGGPQSGIIVGRTDLIEKIKRNPMKRAMRVDKLILAALEAVLRLYQQPTSLAKQLPVMRLLSRPLADIDQCAWRMSQAMTESVSQHGQFTVVDCHSQIGSGALPGDALPSRAVQVAPTVSGGTGLLQWATALRQLPRPVICRIQNDRLLLDMRCLEDEASFVGQLRVLSVALNGGLSPC
ncbi:MAG: L-seryl-tRNA(Sec) selenium transferase [Burkholderiaceae bacterium]